jgi:hypothetical protein
MTPEQTALARGALGLPNDSRKTWRNSLFVRRGSPEHALWTHMVESGVAVNFGPMKTYQPDCDQFSLRLRAAEAVLLPGERIERNNFAGIDG